MSEFIYLNNLQIINNMEIIEGRLNEKRSVRIPENPIDDNLNYLNEY